MKEGDKIVIAGKDSESETAQEMVKVKGMVTTEDLGSITQDIVKLHDMVSAKDSDLATAQDAANVEDISEEDLQVTKLSAEIFQIL